MSRWALTAPAAAAAGYLARVSLAARPAPVPPDQTWRLLVLVPAHDEEAGIAHTLAGLLAADYPRDRFRVVVIADNCTDATAQRALDVGAEVLTRTDPTRRGKGYALQYALHECAAGEYDAVVVVDADTTVGPEMLTVLAGHLQAGADVVQADYRVRSSQRSWRTALVDIGFACSHGLRSSGRSQLGLSAGLKGNGMAFRREILDRVPFTSTSEVEDLEYGVKLALEGVRVVFATGTTVWGDVPATATGAVSQRVRWERGRRDLRRRYARALLARSLRGDRLAADAAADLFVPPLAQLGAALAAGTAASVAIDRITQRRHPSTLLGFAGLLMLGTHVALGWQLSGTGRRGLAAIGRAPVYAGWKQAVRMRGAWRAQQAWQRAERREEAA